MSPTPFPYRVRVQATALHKSNLEGSWLQARIDRFTRAVLLRAYRRHGNKSRAAKALGITYRAFRYQWDRLIAGAE